MVCAHEDIRVVQSPGSRLTSRGATDMGARNETKSLYKQIVFLNTELSLRSLG